MSSLTASNTTGKIIKYLMMAFSMLLLACSGRSVDPTKRTELSASRAANVDAPVDELYDNSRDLYERGLYQVAIDTLRSLINNYPTSEYTEFAKVKLIDSYFQVTKYSEAAKLAQEFLSLIHI